MDSNSPGFQRAVRPSSCSCFVIAALKTSISGLTKVMPLAWNLMLRKTGATALFSHDLPFRPFPISYQDTGSGVFTIAVCALALGAGPLAAEPGRRTAATVALAGAAAFLVDVYLY